MENMYEISKRKPVVAWNLFRQSMRRRDKYQLSDFRVKTR